MTDHLNNKHNLEYFLSKFLTPCLNRYIKLAGNPEWKGKQMDILINTFLAEVRIPQQTVEHFSKLKEKKDGMSD